MSDKRSNESTFHGHSVNVTGFLGGISFATMVLLIGSESLQYSEYLITAVSIVSVLFIISTLGMMRLASGEIDSESSFAKFMAGFASAGFFGLMGILPAIVWQFTIVGALTIIAVEIFVVFIFFKFLK